MTRLDAGPQPDSLEIRLADLVEEIRRRLAGGDTVDPQVLAEGDEKLAAEIAELMPALALLNQLEPPADGDPTLDSGSTPSVGADAHSANGNGAPQVLEGVLGDYRILREVGRGGMGVVYEAQQISLDRPVALKVLPFASMLDEKHLARFQNEARAAATLDHEHIVHAYAVGCERGVHYFAMQFVEGQNLAAAIKELRGRNAPKAASQQSDETQDSGANDDVHDESVEAGQDPQRQHDESTSPLAGLSTGRQPLGREYFKTIARLTAQAAEALDYAHQRGIVHRDIKPSNLLLDAQQRLHITDFGLASIEGDRNLTATGDIVGTLRYMSPEQAAGDTRRIDHRTDVYSLGATLYELAALRPAFEGTDHLDLLRRIASEEPPALRRRDRRIPADLETIVAKAMAKEPADRYATAADLAQDLRRFADDQPILARPPGPVQRVTRWARRHAGALITTLAFMFLVTVGSIVATGLIWHEKNQTELARIQSDANARAAIAAEANEHQERLKAEQAEKEAQATLKYLIAAFSSPHPEHEGRRVTVVEALDHAVAQLQDDPTVSPQHRIALLDAIAATYLGLNEHAKAADILEMVVNARRAQDGMNDQRTIDSMLNLAGCYCITERPEQAIPVYEACLAYMNNNPERYADSGLIAAMANAYLALGRHDDCLTMLEKTYASRRDYYGPEHEETLSIMNMLAVRYGISGRYDDQRKTYSLMLYSMLKRPDVHRKLLYVVEHLAVTYRTAAKHDELIHMLESTYAFLLEHHTNTVEAHKVRGMLAIAYTNAGQEGKAATLYEAMRDNTPVEARTADSDKPSHAWIPQLIAIWEQALERSVGDPDDESIIRDIRLRLNTLYSLAEQQRQAFHTNDDETHGEFGFTFERTLLQRMLRHDSHFAMTLMNNIRDIYWHNDRMSEAIAIFELLVAFQRMEFGDYDKDTLSTMKTLEQMYCFPKRYGDAIRIAKELLDIRQKQLGAEDRETLGQMRSLSDYYGRANLYAEAIEVEKQRLAIYGKLISSDERAQDIRTHGVRVRMLSESMRCLATLYRHNNDMENEIVMWKAALDLAKREFGSADGRVLREMRSLGHSLRKAERYEEAIEMWREIVGSPIRRTEASKARDAYWLGRLYSRAGKRDMAIQYFEVSLEHERNCFNHSNLALRMSRVAAEYYAAGRVEDACEMISELENVLDQYSHQSITEYRKGSARVSCGTQFVNAEAWELAEPLLRGGLAILERSDPERLKTHSARSMLGESLLGQGELEEAEPLLVEGYLGMKEVEASAITLEKALRRLVKLYEATNKPEEADQYRQLLGESAREAIVAEATDAEEEDSAERDAGSAERESAKGEVSRENSSNEEPREAPSGDRVLNGAPSKR